MAKKTVEVEVAETPEEQAYLRYKAALARLRELEKEIQAAAEEYKAAHAEMNKALLGETS